MTEIQQQIDTLEERQRRKAHMRAILDRELSDLESELDTLRAELEYQQTGLRRGDKLLMTEAAQQIIMDNNRDHNDPYGSRRIWPIGVAVVFECVSGSGMRIKEDTTLAPNTVAGIPLDVAQAMRRAYVERESE